MFCPKCAIEDLNQSQYCRACGTELQIVRAALQRPDAITRSDITARNEIGRAIASKIEELNSARELTKVVEDVLPQVEKFLESPEERRLREFRNGVITAGVGVGLLLFSILLLLFITNQQKGLTLFLIGTGGSLITMMVGLGLIINARYFRVPPKEFGRMPQDKLAPITGELITSSLDQQAMAPPTPPSITEGRTRHLK